MRGSRGSSPVVVGTKPSCDSLYSWMICGWKRYSRNVKAPSLFCASSGIIVTRSMLTRTLRSAGSSVMGSGKVPRSRSGAVFAISLNAQGPWRYMAPSPFAKATLPKS